MLISGVEICETNAHSLYSQIPHKDGMVNIVTLHGQTGSVSGVDQVNIPQLKIKGSIIWHWAIFMPSQSNHWMIRVSIATLAVWKVGGLMSADPKVSFCLA